LLARRKASCDSHKKPSMNVPRTLVMMLGINLTIKANKKLLAQWHYPLNEIHKDDKHSKY
jgi:hypothetical protein